MIILQMFGIWEIYNFLSKLVTYKNVKRAIIENYTNRRVRIVNYSLPVNVNTTPVCKIALYGISENRIRSLSDKYISTVSTHS